MRKKRMRLRLICMTVLFLLTVSGCQKENDERTEITLIHGWGSADPDHVAMRQIYSDFELTHPEIKVNLISMPSANDVIRKVQEMLTVGEMPDVVFTAGAGEEVLYEFMVEKGYALDLAPYIEEDPDFKENISETALSKWRTEDGKIYTLSDVLLLSGYWYNEDLFEAAGIREIPRTWEDFITACRRIQRWSSGMNNDVTSIVLEEECLLYLTDAVLATSDPDTLTELSQGTIDLASSKLQPMLDVLRDISQSADLEQQFSYRDTLEVFNSGKSAMYVNGVWASTMIHDDLRVKYAAFPSNDGTGTSCISSCVGYLLGDTASQEKKDASVAFLKYMLSNSTQERILRETGQIVSNPKIDVASLSDNERLLQAVSCVQNAGHVIEVPENIWRADAKEQYLGFLQENLYNIDSE